MALPTKPKKTGYGHGGAFSLPIQGYLCLIAAVLLPPTGYHILSSATVIVMNIPTEQKDHHDALIPEESQVNGTSVG